MSTSKGRNKPGRLRAYYGVENAKDMVLLLCNGTVSLVSSVILIWNYSFVLLQVHRSLQWLPPQIPSFGLGFAIAFLALLSFAYWLTFFSLLYTSLFLRFRMAERMVSQVPDWSRVESVLDVGCGKGILLNTVALRLRKEGSGGRIVGVDLWLKDGSRNGANSMAATLKLASKEGVGEHVTCKTGDCRNLPFSNDFFDVVVSSLFLHNLNREGGGFESEQLASKEREMALREMIRVVKPGGHIVIWDILHSQHYFEFFTEQGMESVQMSENVSAYMLQSRIVSAIKPSKSKSN